MTCISLGETCISSVTGGSCFYSHVVTSQSIWMVLDLGSCTMCSYDSWFYPPMLQSAMEALRSLTHLELEDVPGLGDRHLAHLACLTRLTTLEVMGVSNPAITNAGLNPLTKLTNLRRLKWHAGGWLVLME